MSARRKAAVSPAISIQVHDPRWKSSLRPYCREVREACEAALVAGLGKRRAYEITVVLAGDSFIRELNKTYRGKNKATNVLSFPNPDFSPATNHQLLPTHLGDIVLAYDTIAREAKAQRKTFRAHAVHMLVHGVLHLAGFDHAREKDAETMEALEIKILKKLNVSNPYL